jgi:hypothetical protein
MHLPALLSVSVLPVEDENEEFDGEAYIEEHIAGWGKQNVILLDPFAMWQKPKDQLKRDRYGVILDRLIHLGADAPPLLLFWVWGQRHHRTARENLNASGEATPNGYQQLRGRLLDAGLHFVCIKWCWNQYFAMWVAVPGEHQTALRKDIDMHCRLLSGHLVRPKVEVAIE